MTLIVTFIIKYRFMPSNKILIFARPNKYAQLFKISVLLHFYCGSNTYVIFFSPICTNKLSVCNIVLPFVQVHFLAVLQMPAPVPGSPFSLKCCPRSDSICFPAIRNGIGVDFDQWSHGLIVFVGTSPPFGTIGHNTVTTWPFGLCFTPSAVSDENAYLTYKTEKIFLGNSSILKKQKNID